MKSIYYLLISIVLIVAFNNCSNQGQFAGVTDASSSMGSNHLDLDEQSFNKEIALSSAAAPPALKLSISKSLNGGWDDSLKVCSGSVLYFKTTGVKSAKTAKGCASRAGTGECLDLNKHRSFLQSEIINGDIITMASAEESRAWVGSLDFFVLEDIDANSKKITKVATATISNCNSAGQPLAGSCNWKVLNPRAVFGGGPAAMPPDTKCTQSIVNTEQMGVYRVYTSDVGYESDYRYRCECS